MTRLYIITILTFCLINDNYAQTQNNGAKVDDLNTDYNRNALTVLIRKSNNTFAEDLKKASENIIIPGKFDDNLVNSRIISVSKDKDAIKNELTQQKIPNEILSKWFARDNTTGKFNMAVIHQRGLYNATDDEVRKASGSKLGMANLKDAGEKLINGSYILVLDFSNIVSYKEKYDRQDAWAKKQAKKNNTEFKPVKRRKNGWTANVEGYLYKLNFNDSVINVFYNDLWIYDSDNKAQCDSKIQAFNSTQFPVKFVAQVDGRADGSQYNPGEILAPPTQLNRNQLFEKLVNTGIDACVFSLERKVDDFKVKTPLYGTHPLKAKIGKKEGLKTENRYFVYEFQQNRRGKTVTKRKGVVRAKKVINNKKIATGASTNFSTFYQVAGHRLMSGMTLEQHNDFGIGITGGSTLSGVMGGGFVKAEVNVGAVSGNFIDVGMTQIKIFGTAAMDMGNYDLGIAGLSEPNYDMTFTRFQVGLSKGYYFARYFSIAFYGAYAMEMAFNSDVFDELYDKNLLTDFEESDGQSFGSDFMSFGAYVSINLTYWAQLIGGVNVYAPLGTVYDKDRKELILDATGNSFKYNDLFNDRKGTSVDVGLRIEF